MRYRRRAETFFRKEEKERIEKTTHAIESRTIGEVAVMVVDSSSHYREAEVLAGTMIASLLSLIVTATAFHSSVWFFIPVAFLFFFPSRMVSARVPFLKLAFIGRRRREEAVRLRAIQAFYEKGLYRTRLNTGVLFFLSIFERKVWVLADKGICEKIDRETLNRFAMMVSQGIREGRACDALCDAMSEAGNLLERHFPFTPGDTDELSNKVITE